MSALAATSVLTALRSPAGRLLSLLALVLLLFWRVSVWHSDQCTKAYKAGVTAAREEMSAKLVQKAQRGVESAREVREDTRTKVRVVTKVVERVQHEIVQSECTSTGDDFVRLLNEPIRSANEQLHLH